MREDMQMITMALCENFTSQCGRARSLRINFQLMTVLQEAELESFLFAGNAHDITGFGREEEEQNERFALADLIAKVRDIAGSLLTYWT